MWLKEVAYLKNLIEWNHADLSYKKFFRTGPSIQDCINWIQSSPYQNKRLFPMFLILLNEFPELRNEVGSADVSSSFCFQTENQQIVKAFLFG